MLQSSSAAGAASDPVASASELGKTEAVEHITGEAHVSREDAKRKVVEMKRLLQQHGNALGVEECRPQAERGNAGNDAEQRTGAAGGTHEVCVEIEDGSDAPGQRPDYAEMSHFDDHLTQIVYGSQKDSFWVVTSSIMLCITYVVIALIAAIVCWQFIMYQYEKHVIAWVIGAVFVMISVPLALQDIHFHIIHYVSPLQRHYIRILWMIPIYAVESWLALRFNKQKIYLETMREAYEAYVVYSFFKLMREFLGDKPRALARLKIIQERTGRKTAKMLFPCCCIRAWRLDAQFLTRNALGVYQYVVIRTCCSIMALVLEQFHLFGEGHYSTDQFYIYYVVIVNCSQCWALWCLVLFYHVFSEDLKPIRPLPKFLIIKAVVFVSWWQGIIIMYMASQHMIHPVLDYSGEDVAKGLQNLLITAEMLIYGLFYHYIFSYSDFQSDGKLSEWLQESKAVMKKPEDAFHEMMPIDVLAEGKGYVERVPKYVMRNIPEGVKNLPDHVMRNIPEGVKKLPDHFPKVPTMPHLPNPLHMGRKSQEKETTELDDSLTGEQRIHAVLSREQSALHFAEADMKGLEKVMMMPPQTSAPSKPAAPPPKAAEASLLDVDFSAVQPPQNKTEAKTAAAVAESAALASTEPALEPAPPGKKPGTHDGEDEDLM